MGTDLVGIVFSPCSRALALEEFLRRCSEFLAFACARLRALDSARRASRYASLTRAWGEHDPRADIAPAPPPLQEKRGMSPTLAKRRLRHTRLEIPAKRG